MPVEPASRNRELGVAAGTAMTGQLKFKTTKKAVKTKTNPRRRFFMTASTD
jgi:hypothetical protein